jgi:hypothetical protein
LIDKKERNYLFVIEKERLKERKALGEREKKKRETGWS